MSVFGDGGDNLRKRRSLSRYRKEVLKRGAGWLHIGGGSFVKMGYRQIEKHPGLDFAIRNKSRDGDHRCHGCIRVKLLYETCQTSM